MKKKKSDLELLTFLNLDNDFFLIAYLNVLTSEVMQMTT